VLATPHPTERLAAPSLFEGTAALSVVANAIANVRGLSAKARTETDLESCWQTPPTLLLIKYPRAAW
jgi:hypothetical protein